MTIERMFSDALSRHRAGDASGAERSYREILAEAPDHGPTLHHLGLLLISAGRSEAAVALLRRAAICDPDNAICRNNLANLLRELGHADEAIQAYESALRLRPDYVNAKYNLASLLLGCSDPRGATRWYREVLEAEPDDAEALSGLGLALEQLGEIEEATECLQRALALKPRDLELHLRLAGVLRARGDLPGAASALRDVVRIDPRNFRAKLALAGVLFDQHDDGAAETVCLAALEQEPEDIEGQSLLGNILMKLERWDEAEAVLGRALARAPGEADLLLSLGNVFLNQSKLAEAIRQLRLVPRSHRVYPTAQNNLGNCLQKQGHLHSAISAFRRALAAYPDCVEAHSNILFCSNYLPEIDSRTLFEEHRTWAAGFSDHLGRCSSHETLDRSPDRTLRVGYISPNLCFHSVAFFIDAVLESHDREWFDVTCYSSSGRRDHYAERLQGLSDRWRDVHGLDDKALAATIREDAIDVLVDLAGHTGGNRLLAMARRPAPVLVTYLGYPNTTGVSQIAYRITDAWADPPGSSEAIHTETLLRLPSGFLCFRPSPLCPDVVDPPVLRTDHVTFASFNNTAKVNTEVIGVWSDILHATPGSRLLLKSRHMADPEGRRVLLDGFSTHGITAERIEIVPGFLSHQDHLELYHRVDVALDPFPYNGTTTTCEALWMGVPVVTLAGETHRARVGVSLMQQMGMPEHVAATESEYRDLATTLAGDQSRLRALRHEMRARMAASPLTDARLTTGELESAYRWAWERWCRAA